MSNSCDTETIEAFLKLRTDLLAVGRCILVERQKNTDFLVSAGLTETHVNEEIGKLTLANYSSGPEVEHQAPYDEVWIFGCDIDTHKVYVKVVVRKIPDNRPLLKVLSFHEEELGPLRFPFR